MGRSGRSKPGIIGRNRLRAESEPTADLRREEIARIASALCSAGIGHPHATTAAALDAAHAPDANRLHELGLRRSQDTATARIAALDEAAELADRAAMLVRTGPDDATIPLALTSIALSLSRRAVLSGETRTGGEPT